MSNSIKRSGRTRDSYLELVKQFPLTSIRSDRDLAQAEKMLDSLLKREPLDEGAEIYLEALSDLIAVYEAEHVTIGDPGDAEVLKHLMEARGLTQSVLARDTGISKSTISEILSGKRKLTRMQIARLSQFFNVGQGTFTLALDER